MPPSVQISKKSFYEMTFLLDQYTQYKHINFLLYHIL